VPLLFRHAKYLCDLPVVIVQKPTEPFPAPYRVITSLAGGCAGHEHDIAFPLVWTLLMEVNLPPSMVGQISIDTPGSDIRALIAHSAPHSSQAGRR
jgi:hypothetical protein